MKGVNQLRINGATMQDALTYWLNETQLRGDAQLRVTEVTWEGGLGTFLLKLEEPQQAPAGATS